MPTLSGHLEHNPYVGPRPIGQGEPIYGRDAEVEALYCELQARRIVVLHSPSGAGKSSLVQAGLIPKLEAGGFAVWRPIRVNLDLTTAEGVPEGTNRYLLSALSSLEDELPRDKQRSLSELAQLDFSTYLQTRPRRKKQVGRPLVLLFDQFEEVLTVAPQAVEAKRAFFSQMGQALEHENTWALLIIREDFLAAFAPYRDRLPTHMTNTFRLDLLGIEGAREAALRPAESAGRKFPAVGQLVRDLSITKVQQADGSVVAEPGIYVEPVQLQVVCRRLWASMPEDAASIEHEHIAEYASVSESLAAYYAQAMAEVSGGDVAIERTIREWVGETLIVGGIRSQVRLAAGGAGREKDETTAALDRARIQGLLDTYLIRVEPRAGVDWYELSHDRLVEPVQQDNERWAQQNLHPVQVQAKLWVGGRRAPGLLLSEAALPEALAWAQDNDARLTEDERDFLKRSQELRARERQARRQRRVRRIAAASGVGLLVAVGLGWASVVSGQSATLAEQNEQAKQQNEETEQGNEALEEQQRALTYRLAVQQGQQASMLAESGEAVEAVRLAIEAWGELNAQLDAARPEVVASGATPDAARPDAAQSGAAQPDAASDVTAPGAVPPPATAPAQATAPASAQRNTPMPFEVFKGLSDALGRVQAGIDVRGHVTDLTPVNYSSEVLAVAYAPDGSQFATASYDKTIRLWSAHSGAALQTLEGHGGAVNAVAYSPDGKRLATASDDKTARIWDVRTGQVLTTLPHDGRVESVAFAPDGMRLVTASGLAAWVWHLDADALVVPLVGHEGWVTRVAFSPDGTRLVTASRDHTVRVWDPTTGALLQTLADHDGPVVDVAVSRDGTRLATGSRDKTARVWDLATGEPLARIAYGEVVQGVAFSPDGQRLATASFDDDAAHWWDIATGHRLASFRHAGPVVDVAVSPSGDQLVTGSWDKTARSWDLDPGPAATTLLGHTGRVDAVALSPDGTRIATASGDQTARVWDAHTGAPLAVLRGHTLDVLAVAYSPKGTRIATTSWDGTARVWDARTGATLHTLHGHTGPVQAVVFSPDGTRIATAGRDQTARVWDARAGRSLTSLEHDKPVRGVVFSPDGEWLITVLRGQPAQVWNVATGKPVPKAVTETMAAGFAGDDPITAVAFSPDGQRLAAATRNVVRVWATDSGRPLPTLAGHMAPVVAVTFAPDGRHLATASQDQTARVWDTDTGQALRSVWQPDPVLGVALAPEGRRLVTTTGAEEARVWSLAPHDWVGWGCTVLETRGAANHAAKAQCDDVMHERPASNGYGSVPVTGSGDPLVATLAPATEPPNPEGGDPPPERPDPPEVITVHGVELVRIPGGTFMMGSPEGEGNDNEQPQHEVTLDSFYMARTEVTNAQYALYLEANPDVRKPGAWGYDRLNQRDQPVVLLNWHQAQAYCDWAGLSLPTEAQWEYAARAGTTTRYWFGPNGEDLARFDWYGVGVGNARNRTHSVGKKAANPFGLYDMHGNVIDWCLDNVGPYTAPPRPGDGLRHAPTDETARIGRGGSWLSSTSEGTSTHRYTFLYSSNPYTAVGLRPVKRIP